MSILRNFNLLKVISDAFKDINVQYPMPTDSDSIYAKDVWVDESVVTDWVDIDSTGEDVAVIPFTNLHTRIQNSTATNPKTILIHFNRTVNAHQVGIGCQGGGDFSNVFVKLLGSGGTIRNVFDDSANNTKYTSNNYPFDPELFNALLLEFHTADTVTISNITIQKSNNVAARIQGLRADNTIGDVSVTNGNNLKISLEELETGISANSNTQLRTTVYDELGYAARVEPGSSSLINISFEHSKIHDGKHFFYTDFITLGSGATQDYLITTPAGDEKAHFIFRVTGTLSTDVSLFEGADRSGTTLQTIRNNNRDSVTASVLTVHKGTSGGTTDGTNIHPDGFGTGVAGGFGGASERENEIILKANTKYILRLLSNVNGNRISVHLDWYEHTRINP